MARTDPTIYMRIPQELKDALDAASAENKRSLTAEVVSRLEGSLKPLTEKDPAPEDLQTALSAQLSVMHAGLQLTKVAADFLSLEIPTIHDTRSFPMIQRAISAALKVAPEGIPSISKESFDAANGAIDSFRVVADQLGLTTMVAALKSSSSAIPETAPSTTAVKPASKKSKKSPET